jgi:hypothetical protein
LSNELYLRIPGIAVMLAELEVAVKNELRSSTGSPLEHEDEGEMPHSGAY